MAINYFNELYTSEVFHDVQRRVTPNMNHDLTRMVSEEEVYRAVMDIGAHKTPGPDGFTAVFYHSYWEEIKQDVMKEITGFFETGEMDHQLSHTNI